MPNELIGNGAVILRTQRGSKEETGVDIMVGVDNLETESADTKGNHIEEENGKEFTEAVQYTKIIQANQPQKIKMDLARISPKLR